MKRRVLLQNTVRLGTVAAIGDLGFLQTLRPVAAEEARVRPEHVQFRPEMEPLVRLLETTPRAQLLEKVAARIHGGTSYQEILGALLLAGVRNVKPQPVGFKFHAVLVVNSAHQASLASPDSDRWLPIFWALDYFKSSQAQDVSEGDWTLPAVKEALLPAPTQARERFIAAMDRWDEPGADLAVAQLARTAGASEIIELFWRYGARDFRDIGHKAIYVANAWRTLQVIGWQHAEPVLRSLTLALLQRGSVNPAEADEPADRPWRRNLEQVRSVRPDWIAGKPDSAATADLLAAIRAGTPDAVCTEVTALLNRGVAASSLWDGVFAGAGELLMRRPGILGIHCVTSANALRYAAETTASSETRLLLLLQAAAFMAMFRESMNLKGEGGPRVDRLEPAEVKATGPEVLEAIFADLSQSRHDAARKTLGYLEGGGSPEALLTTARRLIFLKGTNSHDYKFSSALLEDFQHVSPKWRNRFLAAGMYNLKGSRERDNPLVERTRAALRT